MIVGEMITQEAVDAGLAFDVADTVTDHLDQAGIGQRPDTWTADAGYANEEAFVEAENRGVHLLAPMISDERRAAGEDPAGDKPLTKRPATARAQAKLRTRQGRDEYALRGRTVEPVFGQIKHARGFRQFLMRGLAKVSGEWAMVCTAHNLLKLAVARAV